MSLARLYSPREEDIPAGELEKLDDATGYVKLFACKLGQESWLNTVRGRGERAGNPPAANVAGKEAREVEAQNV